MISDALKPNVQELQKDVMELLEQISSFIGLVQHLALTVLARSMRTFISC